MCVGRNLVLASLISISMFGSAFACSPPPERPVAELYEEAVGAYRARIVAARLVNTADFDLPCDAALCDFLEIEVKVIETFKRPADGLGTVYAAIPFMCITGGVVGWEYLLYLDRNETLAPGLFVGQDSEALRITGSEILHPTSEAKLTTLRRLSSDSDKEDPKR